MSKFLVAGIVNVETTVKIDSLPIKYKPITFLNHEIESGISGGAYNVSKALDILGNEIDLLSLVGKGKRAKMVIDQLTEDKINCKYVLDGLQSTPQSVVIYEKTGSRQVFCDLEGIQQCVYDQKYFLEAIKEAEIAVLLNSNFCRPFLKEAKKEEKCIATHVHAISDIYDTFNEDFMREADILFVSDDNIEGDPYNFIQSIEDVYKNDIIVLGLGKKGALLLSREDKFVGRFPAVKTREIVNKLGAGDAMFSAFLHFYQKTHNPYYSIKNAILFSSYKIGTAGSANGFLTEAQLEQYYPIIWK